MLPSSLDGFLAFRHKVACHLKKNQSRVRWFLFCLEPVLCLLSVAVLTQLKSFYKGFSDYNICVLILLALPNRIFQIFISKYGRTGLLVPRESGLCRESWIFDLGAPTACTKKGFSVMLNVFVSCCESCEFRY